MRGDIEADSSAGAISSLVTKANGLHSILVQGEKRNEEEAEKVDSIVPLQSTKQSLRLSCFLAVEMEMLGSADFPTSKISCLTSHFF